MGEITEKKDRREIYRALITDPQTAGTFKKYSFTEFESKLLSDEKAATTVGQRMVSKGLVPNMDSFFEQYINEPAPQAQQPPSRPVQVPTLLQPAQPTQGPSLTQMTGQQAMTPMAPEPQFQPFQQGPSLTDVTRQQVVTPMMPTQVSLAPNEPQTLTDVTTEQAVTPTDQEFSKQETQRLRNEKRGWMEKTKDMFSSIGASVDNMYNKMLIGERYLAEAQKKLFKGGYFGNEQAVKDEKEARKKLAAYSQKIDQQYANEEWMRNINGSVLNAIEKGQWNLVPEAVIKTVADAALQIFPTMATGGYSMYVQTLPDAYLAGVKEVAEKTGRTVDQVIEDGDDGMIVANISAGLQAALEKVSGGIFSKTLATKGGYKSLRDFLIKKGMKRLPASGVALGSQMGKETGIEVLQEGIGIGGEQLTASNDWNEYKENLYNELQTPEAQKRLKESAVGGFVGAGGLIGGGRFYQSWNNGTLLNTPVTGKTDQKGDFNAVISADAIESRTILLRQKLAEIKANPQNANQIAAKYDAEINKIKLPSFDQATEAYLHLTDRIGEGGPQNEYQAQALQSLENYIKNKGISEKTEDTGEEPIFNPMSRTASQEPPPTSLGGIPTQPVPENAPAFVPEAPVITTTETPVAPVVTPEAPVVEFVTVTDDELNAFQTDPNFAENNPERVAGVQEDADAVRNGELTLEAIEDPNYRTMVQMQLEANKQQPSSSVGKTFTLKDTERISDGTGLQRKGSLVNDPELVAKQLSVGDKLTFFQERERTGTWDGNKIIEDGTNNPWGLLGVLSDGWVINNGQQTNDNTNAGTSQSNVDEGVGQRTGSENVVTDAGVVPAPTGSGTGEVLTEQPAAVPLPQVEQTQQAEVEEIERQRKQELDSVVRNVPIEEVRRPNGSIGTQGFTSTQLKDLVKFINTNLNLGIPEDLFNGEKVKPLIDYIKNNPDLVQKIQDYVKKDPIEISIMPDDTIIINDGNHRANLLNLIGSDFLPTIEAAQRNQVDEINAKYDAPTQQGAAEVTVEPTATPASPTDQIADLRAKEQAEYDAMPDPKDKAKRKEIYDRYDKPISDLLAQQGKEEGGAKVESKPVQKAVDKATVKALLVEANDEYDKAKAAFDKKKAELNKTTREDTPDLFGKREVESGLFEMPRISPQQREKAIQPFRDRFEKAKKEVNRLTTLLNKGQEITQKLNFENDEQVQETGTEVRKGKGGTKDEGPVRKKNPPVRNAGRTPDAIAARNIQFFGDPYYSSLQYMMDMTYHPDLLQSIFGGPDKNSKSGRKNIEGERKPRIQFLDKKSNIKTADKLGELLAEKYAEDNNMTVQEAEDKFNFRDIAETIILNHSSRNQMVKAILDQNDMVENQYKFPYDPESIYGEDFNEDAAKDVDNSLDDIPDSYWEGMDLTDDQYNELFAPEETIKSPFTAFQTKGEAGRKAREALKEEVGPEEFKRMDNIHRNGEKMLKELQAKGILEIRCP
jgi:hypothetical protein